MDHTMSDMRAFIAIELSAEMIKILDATNQYLKQQVGNVSVRWVPARNIHLTLKFLGNAPAVKLEELKEVLRSASNRVPVFDISIGKIGAFPSVNKPRVIWVGVQAPGELAALYKGIETGAHSLGFAMDYRPFSAHLTVGRVAKSANAADLKTISQVLIEANVDHLGDTCVDKVSLFKSDLKPGGAVYTCLYSAPLIPAS